MEEKEFRIYDCVPYQTCPKCSGQGIVSKPPWLAGDMDSWTSNQTSHKCDVCQGKKIIPMYISPRPFSSSSISSFDETNDN